MISYGTPDRQISQRVADRELNHFKPWTPLWVDAMFGPPDTFVSSGSLLFLPKACQLISLFHECALTGFSNQTHFPRKFYFCWFRLQFQSQPAFPSSLTVRPTIPFAINFLFNLLSIISSLSLQPILHSTFLYLPSDEISLTLKVTSFPSS